ncbi:MAG: antifreeze protein, partial [Kiloniellales bacterium]
PMPWSVIAADGAPAPRSLPNAALLYALEEASESQRIGETVLLALVVLGEDGPGKSHTIALSAVLSALGRIGLEQEARNLAIEAALANGV